MPKPEPCSFTSLPTALGKFAYPSARTQSQAHIRPLHWYTACRLVIEGGFDPDWITPRPPFVMVGGSRKSDPPVLHHEPSAAGRGEQTVLGGLKTKQVDVVVAAPRIGPVLAISLKGTHNAFRNLTNRMEEAAGDCTNLHMSYPALVYGFWHVLRENDEGRGPSEHVPFALASDGGFKPNDVAVLADGTLNEGIVRYGRALYRLSGRADLREGPSRYEACALTMVKPEGDRAGVVAEHECAPFESLEFNALFRRLYSLYDQRFVYQAPALASVTRRHIWSCKSPFLQHTINASSRFSEMVVRSR